MGALFDSAILIYFAYGAVGGFVGEIAKTGRLRLPRIVAGALDVGFLVAPLIGGTLASLFDSSPQNAIAWGVAAGYAGPSLVSMVVEPLLAKLKLGSEPEPPESKP